MTIIFLSKYQQSQERGVENYVSELSKRLAESHRVEILTSWRELIGKKADIIYPLNGGFGALTCRLYAWITGAKLVLGGHAGIGRDDRWNLYLFPDLFIAFSKKGYEWAKTVNPFVNVVKIPHGVNLGEFSPTVKPKKLNLQKPIIITVSHLDPYKRVLETVKAVATLQKGSLLVLGEGSRQQEVDRLGHRLLGQDRYVRVVVPHWEVPSYLTACDVFTLVSGSQEAFGLVYLEALACNLPVVATNDSLRRELIGNAGLFVNPEDSRQYGQALEEAVEKQWDNRPRRQAEAFDWDAITKRYESCFLTLLGYQKSLRLIR